MRRRLLACTCALMLGLGWLAQADAALLSKAYNFKDDVTLEVGESTADGLRLDSVRFRLPRTIDGEHTRTGGVVKAEVALSNTTAVGLKAGIAIALFDEGNRLVGVASGGSRLVSVKANRQKLYTLVFDNVNAEAHRAATFQISVESKP